MSIIIASETLLLTFLLPSKEEQDLLDLYKSLDHDKFLFVQKLKRFNDEKKYSIYFITKFLNC